MTPLLPIPFLAAAVFLLIRAERRHESRQVYLFKPLSTVLVLLVALLSLLTPGVDPAYTAWLTGGLIFSLGGDVALIFQQRRRAFLIGLVLFLVAHVFYAVAFTLPGGFYPADLISAAVLLLASVGVARYLWPGLGSMKAPVVLYALVIGVMVNRAISTFFSPTFTVTQAWLIAAGAGLFWLSDLLLAVARFKGPFKAHRINLVLYYAGQLLIALSASGFPAGPAG